MLNDIKNLQGERLKGTVKEKLKYLPKVNEIIKYNGETCKVVALDVLKDGGAIGLFPEGTRNKTDAFLLPFKFGAVSMAKKTNSVIVPFGISGDYKFRSKNLRVHIGKPFSIENMTLEEANKKLEKEIGKLIKKGQAMDK